MLITVAELTLNLETINLGILVYLLMKTGAFHEGIVHIETYLLSNP